MTITRKLMATFSGEDIGEAIASATEKLGYSELRKNQELVVRHFLSERDVFVSLPTGSGKSLCYCILPLVFDFLRHNARAQCIVVIVSPLIALMQDQVRAMRERGVSAVNAGMADEELAEAVCSGDFQLVFLSPESLFTDDRWRDMLQSAVYQKRLVGLVVDEAHCVKKWGETFRAAFSQVGEVRSLIPKTVHVMALTATATKETRKAVCRKLGMTDPVIVSQVPNRPNIRYTVVQSPGNIEDAFAPLVEQLQRERTLMERIIIYCRTYEICSTIYLFFKSKLWAEITEPIGAVDLARFRLLDMYTACTTSNVKETILELFCKSDSNLRIVVATIAFGMGLDCPNIRRVIHWGPSGDIEQETGRAGRDGCPAEAVLYNTSLRRMEVEESMKTYCKNNSKCRRTLLLDHFDAFSNTSQVDASVNCCDICCP